MYRLTIYCLALLFAQFSFAQKLTVKFVHYANGKKIEFDSSYINPFGETYTVKKLRYYISNPSFELQKGMQKKSESYLIDAFSKDSFDIKINSSSLKKLKFLLGVDSLHNCSGAQSGDLDPLNSMFWTWQTGYINFKLEGFSPQAQNEVNKLEYHIGGYKGANKTMRNIELRFVTPVQITNGKRIIVYINVTLDKLWKAKNEFTIKESSIITQPGKKAVMVAENLDDIFQLGSIEFVPGK